MTTTWDHIRLSEDVRDEFQLPMPNRLHRDRLITITHEPKNTRIRRYCRRGEVTISGRVFRVKDGLCGWHIESEIVDGLS